MTKQSGRHVYVQEKHINIAAIILGCVAVVALAVTVWALFFRETEPSILAPDFAPQELEQNAEEFDAGGEEKLEAPSSGGGAVSLMFQTEAVVDLARGRISLSYGNPAESLQDILLQVVVQDTLIAQSKRLTPGHQLSFLTLEEGAADILRPGGYEGKFVVSFYDPSTGEKAAVNTEIPITVTVVE